MRRFIVSLALLSACDKEPPAEPLVSDQTQTNQATADVGADVTANSDAASAQPLPFVFQPKPLDGTPVDHLEGELKLTYTGPAAEIELLRGAGSDQSVSGKAMVQPGKEIIISRSIVFVTKPRVLKAKRDTLMIAKRFGRVAGQSGKDAPYAIKEGDTVNLLKAAGDGYCWLSVLDDEFIAGCPLPEDFQSDGWDGEPAPLAYDWWVKTAVKGAQGWLKIDEQSFSWDIKKKHKKRR